MDTVLLVCNVKSYSLLETLLIILQVPYALVVFVQIFLNSQAQLLFHRKCRPIELENHFSCEIAVVIAMVP